MNDVRAQFPALAQAVNGRPVCYLDSAASAQKPQSVIDAMTQVMETHYANVHRGVYEFGAKTSALYEEARKKTARFIHAARHDEIIFTRNATEAINLVAATWGRANLQAGDEIILTELEHHANIVPWHMLAQQTGAVIRVVPILPDGSLDMAAYDGLLSAKTKLVAFTHMSNVLGTILPVAEMVKKAKSVNAVTLVDGSQGAVHAPISVQEAGCDFYVFTGHKLYGPTGIGVLYGRYEVLKDMPPYQGGGEMIEHVAFDKVTYKEPPYRFEAGTPAIVEAIGLAAAMDFFMALPQGTLSQEHALMLEAEKRLSAIPGVRIFSRAPERTSIVSFTLEGVHPHDAATIFDRMGVCVRAGHHCAQPLMKKLGVTATLRASFAAYNTMDDVDRLEEAVQKAVKIFGVAA